MVIYILVCVSVVYFTTIRPWALIVLSLWSQLDAAAPESSYPLGDKPVNQPALSQTLVGDIAYLYLWQIYTKIVRFLQSLFDWVVSRFEHESVLDSRLQAVAVPLGGRYGRSAGWCCGASRAGGKGALRSTLTRGAPTTSPSPSGRPSSNWDMYRWLGKTLSHQYNYSSIFHCIFFFLPYCISLLYFYMFMTEGSVERIFVKNFTHSKKSNLS